MLPINLVESDGMKEMLKRVQKHFKMPSSFIIKKSMKMLYDDKVSVIKSQIAETSALSLTTDAWTSLNQTSFITFTAQYIHNDNLKSCVLQTRSYYVSFNIIYI